MNFPNIPLSPILDWIPFLQTIMRPSQHQILVVHPQLDAPGNKEPKATNEQRPQNSRTKKTKVYKSPKKNTYSFDLFQFIPRKNKNFSNPRRSISNFSIWSSIFLSQAPVHRCSGILSPHFVLIVWLNLTTLPPQLPVPCWKVWIAN